MVVTMFDPCLVTVTASFKQHSSGQLIGTPQFMADGSQPTPRVKVKSLQKILN